MRYLWIDTETTGMNPTDSSAFQLAFILVDNGHVICERLFFLNPLSATIKYSGEAGKIHGYSEEQIRAFPSEVKQMEKIAQFFVDAYELFEKGGRKNEKMVIAGYNVGFDIKHLKALLLRNGYAFENYFENYFADVYEQVKRSGLKKSLPNLKLGTVCNHLGVIMDNAHDALSDIRATRMLAYKLFLRGIKLH